MQLINFFNYSVSSIFMILTIAIAEQGDLFFYIQIQYSYFINNKFLKGHQRAIMGTMTVEEIYQDRKKFAFNVMKVASSDLIQLGLTIVSYTLKDIKDFKG